MSLDPAYLDYPHRKRGMDHDYYPYSRFDTRSPITWPDGKSVAIWPVISLEWFPITPSDEPLRAPGHMQTAYPDYRHYTAREYGTRVGLYRLLDAFEAGLSEWTDRPAVAALSSGTAALHLAFHLADVQAGDEVLVPSMTFVSVESYVEEAGLWLKSTDTSGSSL